MFSALRLLALLPLAASLASAADLPLYEQNFNDGDSGTALFPSPDGSHRTIVGGISGWADGGVLELTHLPASAGAGGALLARPAEGSETTRYYVVLAPAIILPERTGYTLSAEDLRSLVLEFQARIPFGRKVTCYLTLATPKQMADQAWETRLPFPTLTGNGRLSPSRWTGADLPAYQIETFLALARTLGSRPARIVVQWYIEQPGSWPVGEALLLDDIRVSLRR